MRDAVTGVEGKRLTASQVNETRCRSEVLVADGCFKVLVSLTRADALVQVSIRLVLGRQQGHRNEHGDVFILLG